MATAKEGQSIHQNVEIYSLEIDGRNPATISNLSYPIVYKPLYIPGGAGFLPSRV